MDTDISSTEDVDLQQFAANWLVHFTDSVDRDDDYDAVAALLPGRRLSCAEMLAEIEKRKGDLDGRGVNLFRNALTRAPRSGLLENYLRPNLLVKGSHYVHVTPIKKLDWRGGSTEYVVTNGYVPELCGIFGNPLAWKGRTIDQPMGRSYNAGFTVLTVEFDAALPLPQQLAIIYTGMLPKIDATLRRYRDYRGYEVVYSGSKSLHFHFIFDLRHVKRELAFAGNSSYQDNWAIDLPDGPRLRAAYEDRWTKLAEIFIEVSRVTVEADHTLKRWEQLRRFPWALRLIDNPSTRWVLRWAMSSTKRFSPAS